MTTEKTEKTRQLPIELSVFNYSYDHHMHALLDFYLVID